MVDLTAYILRLPGAVAGFVHHGRDFFLIKLLRREGSDDTEKRLGYESSAWRAGS